MYFHKYLSLGELIQCDPNVFFPSAFDTRGWVSLGGFGIFGATPCFSTCFKPVEPEPLQM